MKKKFLSLLLAICLIAGLLPIATAGADTTATAAPTAAPTTAPTETTPSLPSDISISIKLCETGTPQNFLAELTAVRGGAPVYATTKTSGVPVPVTGSSAPSDNYVKFEYPKNGIPTITLKNAKLRSAGNILDLSDFDMPVKIVVTGNSSIESTTKNGIYRASYGDITIVGPKKLTIDASICAIAFGGESYTNSLTLKELTLKASSSAKENSCVLQIPGGNLTVDRSNVSLSSQAGSAVYLGHGNVSGFGGATISHSVFSASGKDTALKLASNLAIVSSNVQFTSDTQAISCAGNLALNQSTLVMTGHSKDKETVDVGGSFTFLNSTAEIIGTNFVIFSEKTLPNPIGEHTVVAGISRDSAAAYNEALVGAYQYYYAEAVVQPEPSVPTETAPTGSDPTATAPTGTDSTGTAPTGTDPTATAPTGTDPTGTDPTATVPTETEPTETIPTEVFTSPTETTAATVPTPPANNASGKNNRALFWILTILMILGACGAAAMAVVMYRRSALEDYEDELDDRAAETIPEQPAALTQEESEEVLAETPQEDIEDATEEVPAEEPQEVIEEATEEVPAEEPQEVIEEVTEEDIPPEEDTDEKPKKFSLAKLKNFLDKIIEDDSND